MNLPINMKKKVFTLSELLVVIAIVVILAGMIFGFVNNNNGGSVNEKVTELLRQEGYHDITIEGNRPWSGSDDNYYKIVFTAVNSASNTVHGVVTGDNYKGWTIRKY